MANHIYPGDPPYQTVKQPERASLCPRLSLKFGVLRKGLKRVWRGSAGHPKDMCNRDLAFPCSNSGTTALLLSHLETKSRERQRGCPGSDHCEATS